MSKTPITDRRKSRIEFAGHRRQPDLAVILENVHDPHNISAVLRTCDSVGIQSVYVVYSDPRLADERLRLGKKTSAGARKWVDVYVYADLAVCLEEIRPKYDRLLVTHVSERSQSLHTCDFTKPTALLFGNEHRGASDEALAAADGEIYIPQMGMVKSLNISVACAVTLYEVLRQRQVANMYLEHPMTNAATKQQMVEKFTERHFARQKGKSPKRSSSDRTGS